MSVLREPDGHRPSENLYEMIETTEDLKTFAASLRRKRVIAVDLEADSMFHFREKVCLIQIATRDRQVLIDPLKISDLSPLAPVFARSDVKKIFHGSDYDIRSLHRDFGIEVQNLFDTQMAARFLGLRETGLESVVKKHFDVSLDKKYQRKDWSKRPLPKEMLDYAAGDTHFLIPLTRIFENKLKKLGRLAWVREECGLLSRVRAPREDRDPLFLRFKGAGRLRPRSLEILEQVLKVRREMAEKKDRPFFKIFGNDAVLKIVRSRPASLKSLERSGAFSSKQLKMYGQAVVRGVQKGLETPEKDLPVYPRNKKPPLSPKVPDRISRLRLWRDRKAEALEMDPALICSKALMTAISVKNPKHPLGLSEIEDLRNWQREAFGEEIVKELRSPVPKNRKPSKKR